LNGYGFCGNLSVSGSGTVNVKNGAVWQTSGDKNGVITCSGSGTINLDNVKAKSLTSGGFDVNLNKTILFNGETQGLIPTVGGTVNVYAGSAIFYTAFPAGTSMIRIHGNYQDGASFANDGPYFGKSNNPLALNDGAGRFVVALDGGTIQDNGANPLVIKEPFRPYLSENLEDYTQKFNNAATKVTGFSLNKNELNLGKGKSETLTASVAPAGASNQNVCWYSSNTSVATVSSTGTVTATGFGTATISAYTQDGGYHADCSVTVALDHFIFYVTDSKLHDMKITYSSNDFHFNEHSYTTEGNWEKYVEIVQGGQSYFINDINRLPALGTIDGLKLIQATSSTSGGADVIPANRTGNMYTWVTNQGGLLNGTSVEANKEMSFRNDGSWTGWTNNVTTHLTAETQYLSVVYDNDNSTAKWKLIPISGSNPPVDPTGVSVSPNTLNLTVGDTESVTQVISPAGAVETVSWTSTNSSVASVNSTTGLVTANAVGSATITATTAIGGHTGTCNVTVTAKERVWAAVTLTEGCILSNDPMQYVVGGSDSYGLKSTPDWFSSITATQKTNRTNKYGIKSNMWDEKDDTCYHTNLDWGKPNTSWEQRSYSINANREEKRYIQITLPTAKKYVKVWFKNADSGATAEGLNLQYSTDNSNFNNFATGLNTGFGQTNEVTDITAGSVNIKSIRILNTKADADWTFIKSAFGIAELELWTADQ